MQIEGITHSWVALYSGVLEHVVFDQRKPLLYELLRQQPSGWSFSFLHHSLQLWLYIKHSPLPGRSRKRGSSWGARATVAAWTQLPSCLRRSAVARPVTCHFPTRLHKGLNDWTAGWQHFRRRGLFWAEAHHAIPARKVVLVSYFTAASLHPAIPTSSCSPTSLLRLPHYVAGASCKFNSLDSPGTGWVAGPRCPALGVLCHW